MDDEQLADLHKFLAEHHRRLAKEAVLDVVQHYHSDLAQRLADEAALIFRRTAIAQRLREGEQRLRNEQERTTSDDQPPLTVSRTAKDG
ncbi:hypothetical protein [Bradyrhizobium sp.]|jgi:hypothetical protein|uniref:hypothetical protein n=1 Tax=Bradyrhizobium sp. TaxID=376 RepID=UPI002B688B54|nr:hypothetical protein [Bradyrhizobium sp.]HMM89746.1 hypothetical protein [Bradyrhizobium sp.]